MSLFGATAQPAATGTSSLFGGQQQQAQQQQQQQQQQLQQQQQQQQAGLLQQSQLGNSLWKPGSLSTPLAQRLNAQRLAVGQFNQRLHEINASLDAILSRHDLETSVRSLAARRRHAELRRRSLALAARVQVLRNRGYALSGDEDDLGAKLAALERGAQDPALAARMEELWSRLITLRDYAESLQAEIGKGALNTDQGGLGEEVEAKAKKILEDYEKQIQHLKKELELVKKDFEEWEKQSTPVSKS
ncbi:hypothetical protein MAPG_01977 [Magnaporthiopsis poae ATCC 64411]|uniref:Nucleoporin Nup54 alpha-helical domain-containing protein n=1 Tax=Magnaporthiopsis poae (strain ATCC 64411 / 73-15) TaxID=644358 RepID=A0A0C4DQ39_MAGP6|nr:hypothetical protein MAPG_01977 [Magnaporthiopsis poae ATCC 64411]